ncbi:MAG: hypothetical protein J7494_05430 [Sphingobium sp.]|nr:hypothetical protein [Sphingobium sp.]
MSPPLPVPLDSNRYGARRRVSRSAWALAIALHIIFAALLILQKGPTFVKMSEQGLNAILLPAAQDGVDRSKSQTKQKQQRETRKQSQAETPPPPAATAPPPPEVPAPSNLKMPFIEMSSSDFAASNIARMQSQKRATGDQQGQGDSKPTYGPGGAPGGGSIYPADWYREPTDAELAGYIRPGQPSKGWGQIACKTVARFHVDECYILGESPMGSGFARSVLNASWQFLVQPPRINGQSQVGTWVSIRITYSPAGAKAGPG